MTLSRFCLYVGIAMGFVALAAASEPQLHFQVSRDSVPLNGEVRFQLDLTWRGSLNHYEITRYGETRLDGLELIRSGSTNRLATAADGEPEALRRISYDLKPVRRGDVTILPVTVFYRDTLGREDSVATAAVNLFVGAPTETGGKGIPGSILGWALLFVALLVTGYFLMRYWQRRENNEEKTALTLEQKYSTLLNETVHISSMSSKDVISGLTKLLNSYIAEKFSIPGLLDEDIVEDRLNALGINHSLRQKTRDMYRKAEKARFADEEIAQTELHYFYDTLEQILNSQPLKEEQ